MLVVMQSGASAAQVETVRQRIEAMGLKAHVMPGAERTAIGVTGNTGPIDPTSIANLSGVKEVVRVTKPFKLVSREMRAESTVVEVAGARFGAAEFPVIAGPCAVESEAQALGIAHAVRAAGAQLFRGGAFKPRTSPYSFQGLGREGLAILKRVRAETGLGIVTEALDTETLEQVAEVADMVQIGARNMQNFSLLRRAGRCGKPVLLKRGMSATVEELLMSAEYLLAEGNRQVVLCERGVRTFADHSRNTLDLSAVVVVQELSHLPIVVDPSHGTGRRDQVGPLARAALAVGCNGLMIEVHHDPDRALSDGAQSLGLQGFEGVMAELRALASTLGRQLQPVPSFP
ncbi:MAG TPA: 3-deoxy-7-phosphoheptulonate synthase [Acidobacteriota bacterium]